MIDVEKAPYGALLLRLSVGILFLLHGAYLKVFVFGMAGTGSSSLPWGSPSGSRGSSCCMKPSADWP